MNIDIKKKLKELEGETFSTVTGKEYTYKFIGDSKIKIYRESRGVNRTVSIADFEKSLEINPASLGKLPKSINGRSYIYGIIKDKRFTL